MASDAVDILMVTYNRAHYTKMALARLLETCGGDESVRVWVWHNGNHQEALNIVKGFLDHPRVYRFHHNGRNCGLNEPTNWLWQEAEGPLLAKVDDDCLMPMGWIDKLRRAHLDEPRFGVLACWHFQPEDFMPRLANKKIKTFSGGHQVMKSLLIQGSGHMMKKKCFEDLGLLGDNDNFPDYCRRLAHRGWIHGWHYPLIQMDHMDDPRSPNTMLKTDEDLRRLAPLSAIARGDKTLDEWLAGIKMNAWRAQAHNTDLRWYRGWRKCLHDYMNKVRWKLGIRKIW